MFELMDEVEIRSPYTGTERYNGVRGRVTRWTLDRRGVTYDVWIGYGWWNGPVLEGLHSNELRPAPLRGSPADG